MTFNYNLNQLHAENAGIAGEDDLLVKFFFILPRDCHVFVDFVLEPLKDEFIQLDLIVVNLKGIFLLEVKNWKGAFIATDKIWKMKQGSRWVTISNPTKQHRRHYELFKIWLKNNLTEDYEKILNYIYPVIVLKEAEWLSDKNSSIPIINGALDFLIYMAKKPKGALTPEIVDKICNCLINSKPYEEKVKYEEGINKYGKKYLRIIGKKEDALKLYEEYSKKYKVSELLEDKTNKEILYFYFEEKN